MNKRQHFPIQGMTCGNCVRHVEKALQNLPGISKLEVSLEKHEAQVEYDSTVLTYESMASALKDAGYNLGQSVD
jgi:copper ion binding protein